MRSILEGLLNAVMNEQASELSVPRNGYRERGLDTHVGTVTLRIPKLSEGSYFPDDVVRRWSRTDAALASAIRDMLLSVSSALAHLDFPREHATWVRTNNVQERMSCEIKRCTRVVQVFPSFDSLVRLVGAVVCDQSDAWLASRNFIDPRSLEPEYEREPLPEEPDGVGRVLRLVREAFDRKRGGWRSIGGGLTPPGGVLRRFS